MKICKKYIYDRVSGYELGLGYIGQPVMTVYFYLLDDILIDTAQHNMSKSFADIIDTKVISQGVLTHHHEDHSGNASLLKRMKNVPLYGHPITVEKMRHGFKILPYQYYMFGKAEPVDMLQLPGKIEGENHTLLPVHTPGHSKDHTVFLEKNQGWLFSGDLFLGPKIKIFRADENFHDMMGSLKRVLQLDFDALFCSINPLETGGKEMIRKKLSFMEDLQGTVMDLYNKGIGQKKIIHMMKSNETRIAKYFTQGNVSYANMIRSILNN